MIREIKGATFSVCEVVRLWSKARAGEPFDTLAKSRSSVITVLLKAPSTRTKHSLKKYN